MMYDIFISYSRKDSQQVNSLIDRLRREIPSIMIWHDIDGIESAEDFQRKIISAINNSKVVLFLCSENSLKSEYCRKEIMYAKNKGKTVVPYLLKGMELDDWLLFEFGSLNCIHSQKEEEVRRMIKDLKRWSGNDFSQLDNSQTQPRSNPIESSLEFDSVSGEFKQKTNVGINENESSGSGLINGHQYIDLGLPSGLKWASSNVGASSPEDYGDYFAWGEIKPKSSYTVKNCETMNKSLYLLRRSNYIFDNKKILVPSQDAAQQNWGGTWRIPKFEEIEELIKYTIQEWTILNGKTGIRLTSQKNENTIFLPAGGWMSGTSVKGAGLFGYYWSSQPEEGSSTLSLGFYFTSTVFKCQMFERDCGRCVRPVSK